MLEEPDSAHDLTRELRQLRQAIADRSAIIGAKGAKMDLRQPAMMNWADATAYLGSTIGGLRHAMSRSVIPHRKLGKKLGGGEQWNREPASEPGEARSSLLSC